MSFFFYAFLLHEKVMFFLVSTFIRMSLSTPTRQSRILDKTFFKKHFLRRVKQPYFEISHQEKDEKIAVLVTNLSLMALRLGGGGGVRAPCLPPPCYAYVVYTQNFDQYVQ